MKHLIIILIVIYCGTLSAQEASSGISLEDFEKILVQERGRIKPMDTYARSILLQLSSKSSYERRPAVAWLADALFMPEKAHQYKVFRINSPEVIQALGIEEEKKFRYSFNQLQPRVNKLYELAVNASKIEEKQRTPVEKELLKVYSLVSMYAQVTRSFAFAIPHQDYRITNEETKALLELNPKKSQYAYIDIALQLPLLRGKLAGILAKDEDQRTATEQELMKLSRTVDHWTKHYEGTKVSLIPAIDAKTTAWMVPFEAIANPNEMILGELNSLVGMANAYRSGDSYHFGQAVREFNIQISARINDPALEKARDMELFYHKLDPFYRAQILYGLAFIFSLLSLLVLPRIFYWSTLLALVAGIVPHTIGVIVRMLILGRPPVTNLFDTFVFVACVSVFLGFVVEWFNRKGLGLVSASISGLALLLISNKYAMEGDTLKVLVAVLDSNFWLATHVVTISLGYTGCCVAGVVGHIWLLQELVDPANKDRLKKSVVMIYGIMAFGLIFSFVGTVLGGIWADQSWGRFWGWDPKENGALLIVLWCAILFHAKLGRIIGQRGFAIGSIIGIIVVMLAWFGINLLGVGLHSYGFTSGIARALFMYIAAEIVFIVVVTTLISRKEEKLASAA